MGKRKIKNKEEFNAASGEIEQVEKVVGLMFDEGGVMKSGSGSVRRDMIAAKALVKEADELQDLIESMIDEYQLAHSYFTRREFAFIMRNMIFNKSYTWIAEKITERRKLNGLPILKTKEMLKQMYRIRQRYGWFVNAVKRYLYQRTADVFEHTNPLYVVSELNYAARLLWQLSVVDGLEKGVVTKDILGAYRMYLKTLQQMNWIIGEGVKQLKETREIDEREKEVYLQLKKIKDEYKDKHGKELSDEDAMEELMKRRYREQLGDVGHSGK